MKAVLLVSLAAGPLPSPTQEQDKTRDEEPRRSGLVERTGRRLTQLDVTVSGPADQIIDLTADDFELWVEGEYYENFIVDQVCREPVGEKAEVVEQTLAEVPVAVQPPPTTFLFYFDQPHLTMSGRNRAMQIAREIIPALVKDGNRGMLVSNGDDLTTFADLTPESEGLLDAVDRMEGERKHWDPFALEEESRIADVQRTTQLSGITAGLSLARRYQQEERWRTEKALRRFSMVLGRLANLDPPKVVLYFADTMRSNAGEHYVSLFPPTLNAIDPDPTLSKFEMDAFTGGNPFNRVIDEAAAHGVRLYTVHAQGLTADQSRRVRDAEGSLQGLALETGGRAFTGGYKIDSIVRSIEQDLSCLYLISFDPSGLREDSPLTVRLLVKRPKVRAHVRGRIVVQSESARLTSELLAAFGASTAARSGDAPLRGRLVPIHFSDGKYEALLQVFVPGAPVSGAVWDLGASVVSRGKIPAEASGRVSVSGPGVPVVLEARAEFRPGPYEVVAVAHETTSDQTVSGEVEGHWPNPRDNPATVTPISIVQPVAAVFLRDGEVRTSGSLALAPGDTVRVDRPAAFVGMVCWDGVQKSTLDVQRSLSGDSSAEFPPMSIEPGDERCAYFRDLVRGDTMTPGHFTYRVHVLARGVEIAEGSREFHAAGPQPESGAASPAGSGGR